MKHVSDFINIMKPNKNTYYNLSASQRKYIKFRYEYYKRISDHPVFPKTYIQRPENTVQWLIADRQLENSIIWHDYTLKTLEALGGIEQ